MSPPLTTYELRVERTIDLWEEFLLKHAPWGAMASPNKGDAEVTVWLLGNIIEGIAPPTVRADVFGTGGNVTGFQLFRAARQIRIITANKMAVIKMISSGVSRVSGNSLELVRPAPPHVIASWLGAAPRDPYYLLPPYSPRPSSSQPGR